MGLERQLLEGAVANSSKAVLAFGTIDVKPVLPGGQLFFHDSKDPNHNSHAIATCK